MKKFFLLFLLASCSQLFCTVDFAIFEQILAASPIAARGWIFYMAPNDLTELVSGNITGLKKAAVTRIRNIILENGTLKTEFTPKLPGGPSTPAASVDKALDDEMARAKAAGQNEIAAGLAHIAENSAINLGNAVKTDPSARAGIEAIKKALDGTK